MEITFFVAFFAGLLIGATPCILLMVSVFGTSLILVEKRSKFIKIEGGFTNERLLDEMKKRERKSSNLSNNAKIRWEKEKQMQCKSNAIASDLHMPIEDENENKDKSINKEEEYYLNLLPNECNFIDSWKEWVTFRKEIRKKLTKSTAQKQITFLTNQPDPVACINNSIQNGWQGLFEVNNGANKSKGNGSLKPGEFDEEKYKRLLFEQ